MKKFSLVFLTLTMTLGLAACGGGSTSTDTTGGTGGTIVTPAPVTATLTLTVTGVATAPVKVTDSTGTVKFDGTVSGSKTLSDLPRGKYTVTAGAVTNFTAPGVQTTDLTSGDGALTLTYMALPGNALAVTTVSGSVPDWKSGATSVALAHVITTNGKFSSFSGLVSPKGTIAADGTLSIALPDTLPASYLYPYAVLPPLGDTTCTFTGTATDREVQTDWYARKLVQAADSPLGYVQEYVSDSPVSSRHLVSRVYSAADSTIKGTVICQATSYSEAYKDVYDLTLNKGWNTVETYTDSGGIFHAVTPAAGTRVSLLFESFTPEVRVSLGNASVQIKPGERVTTNAMITQIGGYSGTVALTTNVPGISVEPATLTLSPVTTQSLSTQALNDPRFMRRQELTQAVGAASVSTSLTFVASADAAQHTPLPTDQLLLKATTGATVSSTDLSMNIIVPSVVVYFNYGGGVSLDRGQTLTLPVNIYGVNGYSGPVELSLENLPDGVSATTLQTTVGASSVPTMSFTATSTAAVGTKEAQLVANLGGRITRTPVNITVQKPTVQVNFGTSGSSSSNLSIRRGQSQNVSVRVDSQHGFSGSVTLKLSGLPAGVSASPLTVQVAPGNSTNGTIVLTASDSAELGTFGKISLESTGADLSTDFGSALQLSLSVGVGVTATLSEASSIARAGTGLWTLSQNGGSVRTLNRFDGAQKTLTVSLTSSSYDYGTTLFSSPSGQAVVVGSSTIFVVKNDGTTTIFPSSGTLSTDRAVIDAQNQLWSVNYDQSVSKYFITKLNLDTGVKTNVLEVGSSYSSSNIGFYRNTSGTVLYLTNLSSGTITQFDPVSGQKMKEIAVPGLTSVQSLAVALDGTVWGTQYYGGPFRVNADGTLTVYKTFPALKKIAFDAINPNTLWGFYDFGNQITKIDVSASTASSIPVGQISDIAPDAGGGLWAFVSDGYDYNTASTTYLLTLIK